MTEITKTEAVGRLVQLAKEVEIKESIDWSSVNITEDQAYELMASNVIDQMMEVPESYRETIMMSTMVKLLVENMILHIQKK